MKLTDFQKHALVALVRSRADGGKLHLTHDELAELVGQGASARTVGKAMGRLSEWFASTGLPDATTTVIPPDNAGRFLMLPAQDIVDRFGGEAGARAEQDRVRDFDWHGWLQS
ncbi:hypothetical protein [Paracoccus luteus]|uniref:hypothetical protein n=1 Tax=Paracoccus luteus TaxID=2508543 RepID=UPI00107001E6|nr:hypothetical protein [Paracoccus luteus]